MFRGIGDNIVAERVGDEIHFECTLSGMTINGKMKFTDNSVILNLGKEDIEYTRSSIVWPDETHVMSTWYNYLDDGMWGGRYNQLIVHTVTDWVVKCRLYFMGETIDIVASEKDGKLQFEDLKSEISGNITFDLKSILINVERSSNSKMETGTYCFEKSSVILFQWYTLQFIPDESYIGSWTSSADGIERLTVTDASDTEIKCTLEIGERECIDVFEITGTILDGKTIEWSCDEAMVRLVFLKNMIYVSFYQSGYVDMTSNGAFLFTIHESFYNPPPPSAMG